MRHHFLPAIILAALFAIPLMAKDSDKLRLQWDGVESKDAYAKRLSLAPVVTLDLGGAAMELVLIPAGKFMMGSGKQEKGRFDNETPHRVTLLNPFYMGKYSVTQAQYQAVMGNNPSRRAKGALNPVEMISWDDAQAFCRKLNQKIKKTGLAIRLPTEAEWEYACRAGTITKYYSGDSDEDLKRVAWYEANSNYETHPVGQKEPNAFGLHDMHGNVYQWCQDWFADYPGSEALDPQGPGEGAGHVLRGGSCGLTPESCRSAARVVRTPAGGCGDAGFRIVFALKLAPPPAYTGKQDGELTNKEKMEQIKKETERILEEGALRLLRTLGDAAMIY
jgi:formylglycine-generating enzyme required for sulfatase activity